MTITLDSLTVNTTSVIGDVRNAIVQFVGNLAVPVGPYGSRLVVCVFGAHTRIVLDSYNMNLHGSSLVTAIHNINSDYYGEANVALAFETVQNITSSGLHSAGQLSITPHLTVSPIMVLVTSSHLNIDTSVREASLSVQQSGVDVFTVAVGSEQTSAQLVQLASQPSSVHNFYCSSSSQLSATASFLSTNINQGSDFV